MAGGFSIRLTLTGQRNKVLYISFLVVKGSIRIGALLLCVLLSHPALCSDSSSSCFLFPLARRKPHIDFIAIHSLMYNGYSFLSTTVMIVRVVLAEVLCSEAFIAGSGAA